MRSGLRAVGALRSDEQRNQGPVALEVAVVATGARPGDSAAKRQLFTEETQTVLVFEHGAVIRLSAAVADGQLLFLTNKKTAKEVVTQVIRKRSFRPTSCYVDLEFTEPCAGFWGIEFPETSAASPITASLSDEEASSAGAAHSATPLDQQEVERLKKEVAELQTQLKSLTDTGQGAAASATAAGAAPAGAGPSGELARKQVEEKMLEQLFAQEAAQDKSHGPRQLVTHTKKDAASSVVKKANKLATAGAFAAVVVAGAVATYRFGLLDPWIPRTSAKPAPSHAAAVENGLSTPKPAAATSSPASANSVSSNASVGAELITNRSSAAKSEAASADGAVSPAESRSSGTNSLPVDSGLTANSQVRPIAPKEDKGHADRRGAALSERPARISGPDLPALQAPESHIAVTSDPVEYVAPKLIRAVKPVSPPDALRNYVTGNVNVDALVDSTGRIKSVTVLSGPEKLRNTAIEVMKQYLYEPARKNGRAVPAHVQASLQFWYEP